MNSTKVSLVDLFWTFFKIGAITFGGGMAMLPMLKTECIEKRPWATEEEILNYFAIGQCTPGIIAVNTATFVGHKKRGIIGGIVASFGVILPGFIIILLLATVFKNFADNVYLLKAFEGIRIAVVANILNALINLSKRAISDVWAVFVLVLTLGLQILFSVSPVLIVIGTFVFALILWRFKK